MRSLLWLVAASFALLPRPVAAAGPSPGDLGSWLAAAGANTVPAAWAGIWQFQDEDYDCTTNMLLSSDSNPDTLCTNEEVFGDPGLPGWSCSGTVSDTSINVSCSGSEEVDTGCVATFGYTLVATRTGETLSSTFTRTTTFTPTGCVFVPDQCIRTESVGSRIGAEPANCTTAVAPETWGRTKAQYR